MSVPSEVEWNSVDASVVRATLDSDEEQAINTIHAAHLSGADFSKLDVGGMTHLSRAAVHSTPRVVQTLVSLGAPVNQLDKRGKPAILYADNRMKMDNVEVLLECGASVSGDYSAGLMCKAIRHTNLSMIETLYDRWVDLERPVYKKLTPLQYAISVRRGESARALINLGASVSSGHEIILAVEKELPTLVRVLVDAGADVHVVSANGLSLLHYAAYQGSLSMIKRLVRLGVNPKFLDPNGMSAADHCATYGHDNCVEFLTRLTDKPVQFKRHK